MSNSFIKMEQYKRKQKMKTQIQKTFLFCYAAVVCFSITAHEHNAKLLDFAGFTNGGRPYGSLISNGTFLYGMTAYGSTNHLEVVFKYALQVVGIDQFSMDNIELSIYPKPASDNFTIRINAEMSNAQVEIYNVFGQKVYNAVLHSHQNSINNSLQSFIM